MSAVQTITDVQIGQLYRLAWKPEQPGHLLGETVWAVWDGQHAHFGRQPGRELSEELKAQEPELAAFLSGLALPTAAEIMARGMGAFGRWLAAGLPIVSESHRAARAAVCAACPFWEPQARLGLGRCRHRGCGCTLLKWWLATERCPAGKWPA